ncbi:MAG: PD-(D/E)XK nuclease family transposase [Prevotella sp.]|nr:PD-(D/E)XK nuclease family transposase [Prevotella sp.]
MEERKQERYVNPYTDFGFKKLFGTELNKDLLISLLNALFDRSAQQSPGELRQVVKDLQYLPTEKMASFGQRRAVFDVYCEGENGEKFIVEMQQASQDFFKDRSVFYSAFPIIEQGRTGDWDFHLNNVYTVGILNFIFPGDEYDKDCFHHEVKLMDVEDKHVFYDKLTYVYLEMPKFNKTEDELVSMYDKWLFVLKNLTRLMERPASLQERIFQRVFDLAEIARFTPDESRIYEESLKQYRDMHNTITSAERRGREEGRKDAKYEDASKMKELKIAVDVISQVTGLSKEEIESL